eukprot:6234051-Amphidinium_carterae.5
MQIRFIVANVQHQLFLIGRSDIDDNNVTVHTGKKPHIEKNELVEQLHSLGAHQHAAMVIPGTWVSTFTNPMRSNSTIRSTRDAIHQPDNTPNDIPHPGLEQPQSEQPERPSDNYRYVHPAPEAMAKPDSFKPTHRLAGKQPPSIVGQLDNILATKELSLENNEDKDEKKNMETIMKDIQVQPWWQYEDDIAMFSETAVKEAMNNN